MVPEPFVIFMPDPAVKVVRVNPEPFPISICPLEGVVEIPVPPAATGNVPAVKVVAEFE